ncbi:NAD(P)-binding protein [Mytilinidion resinicola]|uniref:NAD(P)-binding protein n=1 Tax=Mytilinidion resinicola TaxID=574789 RepID=A0A6A6Y2B9_9PEZI|nr:NAD(P)-binding protein [Mytilinidion resinicola]KAF2802698.1 NAD(P)-binding protein [Mytilinidion resinicola]
MSRVDAIPVSAKLSPEEAAASVSGSSLKDRSILITGGARGLGAAIGLAYAEKGAYVTLADINETLGKDYVATLKAKGLHVQFITTDVTSWSSQVAAFKAAIAFSLTKNTLDIVVASAGVFGDPFLAADEAPVTLENDPPAPNLVALQVNSIGAFYTAKLAQLYLKMPSSAPKSEPPSLILIASLAAYFDIPLMSSYTSSKYAVRGLFRSIRPLFADRGIRVNLIAPWIMETPLVVEWLKLFDAVGAPQGDSRQVVTAALRFADDKTVNGRAFAIGPKRILDLGDDIEGGDGGAVMHGFYETELPGWDKMADGLKGLMGI